MLETTSASETTLVSAITEEMYERMARLGVKRSDIDSLIRERPIEEVISYIEDSLKPDGAFEEVAGKRILDM